MAGAALKVLIYSDVHANWEALQAVIEAAGDAAATVCLGDVVGYGASPNEATAWVRAHTPLVIRGNHDRACASLDGIEWFNPVAAAAAHWTHRQLQPDHLQWLQRLPAGPLPWQEHTLVHGSPLDEDEYLLDPVQAAAAFAATTSAVHWFGHSHLQGGFVLGDDQVRPLESAAAPEPGPRAGRAVRTLTLRPGERYLINPGSVGQPRDHDWRAAFVLYHPEDATVEFHRVPYDLEAAQRRILDAGLPPRLAQRLAHGR